MSDYKNTALSIIKESEILKASDFEALNGLGQELADTFQNVQMFRTRTEMEASILNDVKYPTADSKYWQAVREQNVMFDELVFLSYEYRKNLLEIKKIELQIKEEKSFYDRELLQVEKEKKEFISLSQGRVAKARIREILEWSDIKKELLPQLTASNTNVDEHQLISYTIQWINEAGLINEHTPINEKNNVLGKLGKAIKMCKDRQCFDKVLEQVPYEVRQKLSR